MTGNFLLSVAIPVGIVLSWTLAVRIFPGVLGEAIVRKIEHRYAAKLSTMEAELNGRYSTLRSSMEFLAAGQSEFRSKVIESVESLWSAFVKIDDEFSDIGFVDEILVTAELDHYFRSGDDRIEPYLGKYRAPGFVEKKLQRAAELLPVQARLFSGERLWLIASTFHSVQGRRCFLFHQSFARRAYIDWRCDEQMSSILRSVLPEHVIKEIAGRSVGGLRMTLTHLQAEFMKEAVRVMSGSQQLADSLADLQSTLLIEQQRLAQVDVDVDTMKR